MFRFLVFVFLLFMPVSVMAQAINIAPEITFTQKVRSIQALKEFPEVLGGKIEQNGNDIALELFIKNRLSEALAKEFALRFIALVKKNSPDTPIESPLKPSTGRFNYSIVLRTGNGRIAYSGLKPAKETDIIWAVDPTELKETSVAEPKPEKTPEEKPLEPEAKKPISLQEKIKANPDVDPLDIVDFPEKY